MKHFLSSLFLFTLMLVPCFGGTSSDNFEAKWKVVEKALQDDNPADALAALSSIRTTATRQKNMPQLCSALFQTLQCKREVSPDSLQPSIAVIREAMEQESRPVQRAIYLHLLGTVTNDDSLIRSSLADMDILVRASTKDYLPLVRLGKDSEWLYHNDLLSLFLESWVVNGDTTLVRRASDIYARRGNRAASLLVLQKIYYEQADLYPIWRKAMDEDPSLQRVTTIAEYLAQVEQKSVSLRCLNEGPIKPGDEVTLVVSVRNLTEACFSIAQSIRIMQFPETDPWQERTDTLTIRLDKAGVYEAILTAGSLRDAQKVHVSSVKPLVFGLPDGRCRIIMVSAHTGEKLINPRLVRRETKSRQEIVFSPANDGYIYLNKSDYEWKSGTDYVFYPQAAGDKNHPGMNRWMFHTGYYNEEPKEKRSLVRIFTDRNIYRPGQQVQVGVISYQRDDDNYCAHATDSLELRLIDTNNQEVAKAEVVTDEYGSAAHSFTLPRFCLPGNFTVRAYRNGRYTSDTSVQVEEYKRPTIEIKFAHFTEEFSVGDTAVVRGQVLTYTGVPIGETEVRCNDTDTLMTDAEGWFSYPVRIDNVAYRWWSYQSVTVDVTDGSGESTRATTRIPVRYRQDADNNGATSAPIPFWHKETYSADRSEATLTVGGDCGPYLTFIDVLAKNRLVEHRTIQFADSFTHTLRYTPEMGDGATLYVALVRDGVLHTATVQVERPRPDKRLKLTWSTFRSDLQPGQEEEWTLRVTHPDGTPADATLMARLYDATLDAFVSSAWSFDLPFTRNIASSRWDCPDWAFPMLSATQRLPHFRSMEFSMWRDALLRYGGSGRGRMRKLYATAAAPVMAAKVGIRGSANMAKAVEDFAMEEACVEAPQSAFGSEPSQLQNEQLQVRENFDETAFFLPSLRTDSKGQVAIRFRLPESLTRWNFTALAHDRSLNYGMLTDTVVARKQLMAQVNAPRFLRLGDNTMVPVTITNVSDTQQDCTLAFYINSVSTEQQVTLAPGERRTLKFPYSVEPLSDADRTAPAPYVTFRAELRSATYSDGEERTVPLLSSLVEVTRSVPYSLTEKGTRTIDLSNLWQEVNKVGADARDVRFSVEQTSNPAWYVANALTPMLDDKGESASSWAERLYALHMAQYARRFLPTEWLEPTAPVDSLCAQDANPFLRNELLRQTLMQESPWVMAAKTEAERTARMAELLDETALILHFGEALTALQKQQSACGGWSWYRGMPESPWITADVSVLLTRMQQIAATDERVGEILGNAMNYLHGAIREDVKRMKEYERKNKTELGLSELHYRYLYVCALNGAPRSADINYLLGKAEKANHDLTMYGKAGTALILSLYGKEEVAARNLRSLIGHTVCTEEMGRYFDTERAQSGWRNYKIPTQTFTIEALRRLGTSALEAKGHVQPEGDVMAQLRLWLLQSKRTQQWLTSSDVVDAVYAVLEGQEEQMQADKDVAGYSLTTYTDAKHIGMPELIVTNDHDHPMWGAAYVQYLLPMEQAQSAESGIRVQRTLEVQRADQWLPLEKAGAVKVGDRMRIKYTLHADRDMDYVCLKAARAACMEPTHALSGYDWRGRCYRAVHDQRTDYFFEHFSKGTHVITDEVRIDRTGEYRIGVAQAECVYAPEFRGATGNLTLSVIEK